MKTILVTGSAGFIGYHLARRLLEEGHKVIGYDNFNSYYEVSLKEARNALLEKYENYRLYRDHLENKESLDRLFADHNPTLVIHLAAQAGVRYSLENPGSYIRSNIVGFLNILEACRHNKVEHLVYASSSSVYGANKKQPFSETDNVDHPVSLYAATKKSNELMAFTYSHLYGIPATGLRFFTVYGPWGRPDMAPILFARAISQGQPIKVFNNGKMKRDFTYVDDIVDGICRVAAHIPEDKRIKGQVEPENAPYRLYNIGNNTPVELMHFIRCMEKSLGKEAEKNYLPLQPGDVVVTYADIASLSRDTGFRPVTSIEEGVDKFVRWFKDYYGS